MNESLEALDADGQIPSLEAVIEAAERMLRSALQAGRPSGVNYEVTELYKANDFKTAAFLAACLSEWHSLVGKLDEAVNAGQSLSLEEISVLLIHRTYNRARRRKYRDAQMAEQVERANVRSAEGEWIPFDPKTPENRALTMQKMPEEIALVLEGLTQRDRMIIEMRYFGDFTPKEIVSRVKAELPNAPISLATITRVLAKFEDALRPRLEWD